MHKIIFICLLILVFFLNQQYYHGRGGLDSENKILLKINYQQSLNNQIIRKNSILKIKISGLKGSQESIEARARYELNLIKPNEQLVIIPNSTTG